MIAPLAPASVKRGERFLLGAGPGASAAMTVGPLSDALVGDVCGCLEVQANTAPAAAKYPSITLAA